MSDTVPTSPALVPKLRFPEFRDARPWENFALNEVLNYFRPEPYIVNSTNYESSGIPVLTANKSFILGYTKEKDNIFHHIPAIIFDDFTTDKKYVDFPFKVKSSAIKILRGKENHNLRIIFELMCRINFDSTDHKRYYISEYQNLLIPLPSLAEQEKIAACLGSLDELIGAEQEKLAALRQHKQGLMQQLFPADGETIPRLRFPEFEGERPWEVQKLEDFAELYKGKGISKTDIDVNGQIPCIRYGELYTIYGEIINTVVSKTNLPPSSLFLSKRNDIIIPSSGETKIDIATASCVLDDNIALGSDLNIIRTTHNGVFLSYYLNGQKKEEIAKIAQGDTVVHLYSSQLKLLLLGIPSAEEQQKIADCLSNLDEQINQQAQKIEALQQHKKGLMQQLFPTTH